MKGISRAESKRSKGWLARVYRDGQTLSRFFSDRKYGGKTKAFHLARAFVQHVTQACPRVEKPPFRTTPLRRNKTGVNGVCLTFHRSSTGAKLRCYNVHYRLAGRIYNKRFYLHWYATRQDALQDAVQFRRAMEKAMLREWEQRRRTGACPAQ
jgi:hypothetical protein